MKKRFIAAIATAVVIPALAGLAYLGNESNKQFLADCNAGNTEICSKVIINKNNNKPQITNKDYLTKVAADQKAAAIAEANKPVSLVTLISRDKNRTLSSCRAIVKSALKDPGSYREVDYTFAKVSNTQLAVRLTYSATNSFGGRIQSQQACGI